MAQQQTTTAAGGSTDSAGQGLRLFPIPKMDARAFWAVHAVNDDTMRRAFSKFVDSSWNPGGDELVRRSVLAAESALRYEANKSFRAAQQSGDLLFAWSESSALEGGAA